MAKRKRAAAVEARIEEDRKANEHSLAAWERREVERFDESGKRVVRLMDLAHAAVAQEHRKVRVLPYNKSEACVAKAARATHRALCEPDFMRDGIVMPLLRAALDKAHPTEGVRQKKEAWFRDEITALKALYDAQAPIRQGASGRALMTALMGATVQNNSRPHMPAPHPALEAIQRELSKLDDMELLWMMYVEFSPPKRHHDDDGCPSGGQIAMTAQQFAASLRTGNKVECAWLFSDPGRMRMVSIGGTKADYSNVRAATLIAEYLGMPVATDEDREHSTKIVEGRVKRARKALREALQAIHLDTGPSSIIPARSMNERSDDASDALTVACCAGVAVSNGVRLPCRDVEVTGPAERHPSTAWPDCDACGRPVLGRVKGKAVEG